MTLMKLAWYFLWPPYRRRVNATGGWWACTRACGHLLRKEHPDKCDLEAARLLNSQAKNFLEAMSS